MTAANRLRFFGSDFNAFPSAAPAIASHPLDANNDAMEWIFQAPAAATITRLGFLHVSTTGTSPTYRISLQGVTAATSSTPDGTIKGATNNALKLFSPSSLAYGANTWNWITLDETYACARGELLSIVIDYSSGTVDGSNFTTVGYGTGQGASGLPRAILNAATVRTHSSTAPVFGYGSAGTAYGRPLKAIGTVLITSASDPREVGIKFTAPSGWGATYTVNGVTYLSSFASSTSTVTHRIYQGGAAGDTGTVLQDVAIANGTMCNGGGTRTSAAIFDEVSLTALNFGDAYRLSLENGSVSNMSVQYFDVAAAADLDAYPGGQNVYWTQRTAASNWADTTTRRPYLMMLDLDDFTEPSSGGGGSIFGGGIVQ